MWLEVLLGLLLLYFLKRQFFSKDRPSSTLQIPGMNAKSTDFGNLEDIGKFGSLHKFLVYLHGKYGDIATFWFGTQLVVSISAPDMFKEQLTLFDRPHLLFKLFEPFIGVKSLQYANKEDGKNRRKVYDRKMSHQAVMRYIYEFNAVSEDLVELLTNELNIGISAHNFSTHMAEFALKSGLLVMFGDAADDSKIKEFHTNYKICWGEMESRLGGHIPNPESEQEVNFKNALEKAKSFVREIVAIRKNMVITDNNEKIIDILIENCPDEETLLSDAITYVVGGFHTTANSLVWGFYYIASHKDVQEKLHAEINSNIGKAEITHENIRKCSYLRQVFDETLRCSVLAPFAARVVDHEDITIKGFSIPAGTPIIHALGVSLQNKDIFPNPETFDPERFNEANLKKLPKLAYQPFGVGKRICPGQRFAIFEASICIATVIRKFKISLADPGKKIEHVHGLVTHPSHEILIKLNSRC